MTDQQRPSVPYRILRVFAPFAVGYFMSYLFRTVNAVIADELTASLGITAAGLGFLTSAYFFAFGAFQAPLGLLLDRFGPRRIETALLLVAAAGAALFSVGEGLGTLAVGRALIGIGVSACLMAAITANVMWWPVDRLPMVNGLFMASGGLGAVFATTPVRALMTVTDWRGLFLGLALVTVACAALLFVVVPERPRRSGGTTFRALLRGTAEVFSSRTFWRMAPPAVVMQGAFMAYMALWAGPWLRDVEGFDKQEVATHLQYAAMAMVAGYTGFALASEALRRRGLPPMTVATTGIVLATVVQVALLLGLPLPPVVAWVLYPLFASASVMIYAILSQGFAPEMAGRVNTAANLLMFVVAFALQWGLGSVIGAFPPGAHGGYAPEGHRLALGIVVAGQVAALLWQLWPRRSAQPVVEAPTA
ncbi:MFS transporter [Azospirillum sp. sgz301742]